MTHIRAARRVSCSNAAVLPSLGSRGRRAVRNAQFALGALALQCSILTASICTAEEVGYVYTDSTCIAVVAEESVGCPDVVTLAAEHDIEFYRYVPGPGDPGYPDLQFVYTNGILNERGGVLAVEAALDDLSIWLAGEAENWYSTSLSDLALLYNMSRVTDAFPWPYGDPYYDSHGGGNFLLATTGVSEDSQNHIDIVITTLSEGVSLRDLGCAWFSRANPVYRDEYLLIEGFPSDEGETTRNRHNGVIIRGLPLGKGDPDYPILMHELGHLFDEATGIYRPSPSIEFNAEFGRTMVGPLTNAWGSAELPYHGSYDADIDDDVGNAWRFVGNVWLNYMAGRGYAAPTGSNPVGGLYHSYFTNRSAGGSADLGFFGLSQVLDSSVYDDVAAFPTFQDDLGMPLSGEKRAEALFRDYSIALVANAPGYMSGAWGFPLGYEPTEAMPLFQDNGGSPDKGAVPPEFEIVESDYGVTRVISSPVEIPSDGTLLDLQVFPWAMDVLVFNLADVVANPGAPRELEIRIKGDSPLYSNTAPPFSPSSPYTHSLKASVVYFKDLDGQRFWQSRDDVLDIQLANVSMEGGLPVAPFVVPLHAGVRTAVVTLTVAELGLVTGSESSFLRSHPFPYHVELNLRAATSPMAGIALENKSLEANIVVPGQPYSEIGFDANGDGNDDLMVASSNVDSKLFIWQGDDSGVPQFDVAPVNVWEPGALPQAGLHGMAAADYDNDGDIDFFASADTDARLYRNDGGTFTDVGPELGITDLATFSWCGAWADYDGDGYLDLLVGRGLAGPWPAPSGAPKKDRLFRNAPNAQQEFLSFENVTLSAGIDALQDAWGFTGSATWGDFDGDGDPDLFTAKLGTLVSPPNPNMESHLYVNNGDGTFSEQHGTLISEGIYENSAAAWADVDNDADLDLIATAQTQSGYKSTRLYRNDGGVLNYVSEEIGLVQDGALVGVFPLDFDLDGTTDILGLPESATEIPRLYMPNTSVNWTYMYDVASQVGLQASLTSGAVVHDWNGDGDFDLFLGRADEGTNSKFYYRTTNSSGADAPANQWVGMRLLGGGSNSETGIGAQVVLRKDGVPHQVQTIDGGSSRGGQRSRDLLFGLGDYAGQPALSADIAWPNGFSQSVTLTPNVMNSLQDETPATVTGLTAAATPQVNLKSTWTFTWYTAYATPIGNDKVTVQQTTGGSGVWLLEKGDPNVTCSITKVGASYKHVLTFENVPCSAGAKFSATAESATDFQFGSMTKAFSTKVCVQ